MRHALEELEDADEAAEEEARREEARAVLASWRRRGAENMVAVVKKAFKTYASSYSGSVS